MCLFSKAQLTVALVTTPRIGSKNCPCGSFEGLSKSHSTWRCLTRASSLRGSPRPSRRGEGVRAAPLCWGPEAGEWQGLHV